MPMRQIQESPLDLQTRVSKSCVEDEVQLQPMTGRPRLHRKFPYRAYFSAGIMDHSFPTAPCLISINWHYMHMLPRRMTCPHISMRIPMMGSPLISARFFSIRERLSHIMHNGSFDFFFAYADDAEEIEHSLRGHL